jgi:hypothetical protein
VETPYGVASQSDDAASLAARQEIAEGATVWRTGRPEGARPLRRSPGQLNTRGRPGFAERYVIPPENVANADVIESTVVRPGSPFVTRPAPAVGPNGGGGIDVVVPGGGVRV